MSNLKLEQWQIDGIAKLAAQGKTQREIAKQLDTSPQTVNAHVKRIKQRERDRIRAELERRDNPQDARKIDLKTIPTQESIITDMLILYRASLAEIFSRLPEMSINELNNLSMGLLRELNGNSET